MYEFELVEGSGFDSVWKVISYGMEIGEITLQGPAVSIKETEYGFADAEEIPSIEYWFFRDVIENLRR